MSQPKIKNKNGQFAWLIAGVAAEIIGRKMDWPSLLLLQPIFLLLFTRSHGGKGLLWAFLFFAPATIYIFWESRLDIFPSIGLFFAGMTIMTLIGMLPVIIDRFFFQRLAPLAASMVYPTSKVILEYAASFNSPYGTIGSNTVFFVDWLPLSQLVSFTGLLGITFIICWFASTACGLLQVGWYRSRLNVLLFSGITITLLAVGYVRLALPIPAARHVKIASVLEDDKTWLPLRENISRELVHPGEAALRDSLLMQNNNDYLLALTAAAADSGATYICWGEGNGIVAEQGLAGLLAQAGTIARKHGAYIGVCLYVLHHRKTFPVENRFFLIRPDGTTAWSYEKVHPFGAENRWMLKGDGKIRTEPSPDGILTAMICFDTDYYRFARQTGKTGAALLFAPSDDWPAIAEIRALNTRFRALENGLSLLRATSHGVTEYVDACGRVYLHHNYYTDPAHLLMASLPIGSARTVYSIVGDMLPPACFFLLAGILLTGLIRRGTVKKQAAVVLLLLLCFTAGQAQDTVRGVFPIRKNILLPAVSYAPETSLALGVLGTHLHKKDSATNLSHITVTVLYTFKNQFLMQTDLASFSRGNRWLTLANVNLSTYATYFYGIGNETSNANKTLINYRNWQGSACFLRRITNHFYGGVKSYYSQFDQVEKADGSKPLPDTLTGSTGSTTVAGGICLLFDSRDNPNSTRKGWYIEANGLSTIAAFGSEYDFRMLDVDIRKFVTLPLGSVLALQVLASGKTGDVPFLELSQLGGSNMMRGLYTGRYRDKDLVAEQIEWRRMFLPRWGMVLFGGLGKVGNDLSSLSRNDWQNSFGFGIRRVLSPKFRLNLRADAGWGNGSANFYVNIGEAF